MNVKELRELIVDLPDDTEVWVTDGDRIYDLEIYHGRVKGREYPDVEWDVTALFIEVD